MKEQITKFLEKNNWRYTDFGEIIRIDAEGDTLSWNTLIKTDDEQRITCVSMLPAKISESRFDAVLRVMNSINSNIWFGNFELITEGSAAGQARFRTSSLLPDTLDEQQYEQFISTAIMLNLTAMNNFAQEIIKANFTDGEEI